MRTSLLNSIVCCAIAMVSPVSHRLKIDQKIALHSSFSKFGMLKCNKITPLLDKFWVGHLNVAYMTTFSKKLNFFFYLIFMV